jgi:hypothetical protein
MPISEYGVVVQRLDGVPLHNGVDQVVLNNASSHIDMCVCVCVCAFTFES